MFLCDKKNVVTPKKPFSKDFFCRRKKKFVVTKKGIFLPHFFVTQFFLNFVTKKYIQVAPKISK